MADEDRHRWNDRYRAATDDVAGPLRAPRPALAVAAGLVPPGRALDLACGPGHEAVWLAMRGWTVDAVDIADEACERTAARAARHGVADRVRVVRADLDTAQPGTDPAGAAPGTDPAGAAPGGLPDGCDGPYDLVWAGHFRSPVVRAAVARLQAGGVLATTRLSVVGRAAGGAADPRFLAAAGELVALAEANGLIVHLVEEGNGESALVALRPARHGS